MRNVVIAGYKRSPFTFANKGGLAKVRPDEIAARLDILLARKLESDALRESFDQRLSLAD